VGVSQVLLAIGERSWQSMPEHILIIGLGNDYRGDDAVGRALARRLQVIAGSSVRVLEESGEGASLIEAWEGADFVILIDAVHSGGAAGTIHRFHAAMQPVPGRFFHYSTHAFSVAEAVELARALNQLPPRLIVYGIEGKNFDSRVGLSPEVKVAAEEVFRMVKEELCTNSRS
jgi:hydrogenase maturation protease